MTGHLVTSVGSKDGGSKMNDGFGELHERIDALRALASIKLTDKIITIMSPKGGQGKSFFAKELAWLLDLILVDLDWDGGRVSRLLGYLAARYKTVPLLDALENGKPPRLYKSNRRPDMVPGHLDFEANQPHPDVMAELLIAWCEAWKRGVMADTHPGGSPATLGAAQSADLVVMPVVLGTGELDAVEESLNGLSHLPLLLVPNMTSRVLPAVEAQRLLDLATTYNVKVADTFIHRHNWMTTRKIRTVIAASPYLGATTATVTAEVIDLAEEIVRRVAA
jgi:chromosome partitioning protein